MSKILIIEPNDRVRGELKNRFEEAGHQATGTGDFLTAQSLIREDPPSLVIMDIDEDHPMALESLKRFSEDHGEIKVIVTAALGTVETAVNVMKLDAVDFLLKPYPLQEIVTRVDEHITNGDAAGRYAGLEKHASFQKIVGKSVEIKNLLRLISGTAASDKTVLISGESGTGKSLFAEVIHEASSRSNRSLLSIDCASFTDEIFLESELFGFAKGAFEGANVPREGLFVKAEGGTLVLEEVAGLPKGTQAKLLRYLQSGEIRRVGENIPISTNTRIIATSKKDLKSYVSQGRFDAGLYFRLNSISLEAPPLRDRGEDIPLLIRHFLKKMHKRGGLHYRFDKRAMSHLCALPYHGNVLELMNTIEQILSVAEKEVIDTEVLERARISKAPEQEAALQKIATTEKEIIQQVIRRHPRDLDAAAQELGISRTTLWRRMKKYDMMKK
jgi:DNA-binding NtrC family response regulator